MNEDVLYLLLENGGFPAIAMFVYQRVSTNVRSQQRSWKLGKMHHQRHGTFTEPFSPQKMVNILQDEINALKSSKGKMQKALEAQKTGRTRSFSSSGELLPMRLWGDWLVDFFRLGRCDHPLEGSLMNIC